MPNKYRLFLIILAIVLVYSYLLYKFIPQTDKYEPGSWYQADVAINQAQNIFNLKNQRQEILDNGPCLSNALLPGWVADVVHSPRQPIDDLPENQCSSFISGEANHFVELDLEGNLVRVK